MRPLLSYWCRAADDKRERCERHSGEDPEVRGGFEPMPAREMDGPVCTGGQEKEPETRPEQRVTDPLEVSDQRF
jgi:hypothetical protein